MDDLAARVRYGRALVLWGLKLQQCRHVDEDGTWYLNNTGFLASPSGVISIDATST